MPGRLLWLGIAVLLALAGCTAAAQQPDVPTGATSPAASASPAPEPVAQLTVGDCTGPVDLTGASISNLQAVPCSQPHHYEVHATIPLTGDVYPGADRLADRATAECAPSFVEYVGVEPEYGRYGSAYLVPDEAAWGLPENRAITCLVGSPDGGLVGSAEGDYLVFPKIGECTGPQNVPALEVEIIDCALAHNYEVFATKNITTKAAPTRAELDKLFNSVCQSGFKEFVGIDSGKSKYEVTYFLAGADVWTKVADHRIVCSAGSPDGGIKGSLEGVKK
ncbi:MAG: septum formation family protein [Propionibacteriaceae bacterium]|nr:septum formation family protein [Propionibacteriaceae bacterium]